MFDKLVKAFLAVILFANIVLALASCDDDIYEDDDYYEEYEDDDFEDDEFEDD